MSPKIVLWVSKIYDKSFFVKGTAARKEFAKRKYRRLKSKAGIKSNNLKKGLARYLGIFVFLGTAAFLSIKFVFSPIVSAYNGNDNVIKDKSIYSILLVGVDSKDIVESASVIIVQRKDKRLYSIDIPVDSKVELPGRFGEEEYKKVIHVLNSVGEYDKSVQGLLRISKDLIGLNIDKYIIADFEDAKNLSRFLVDRKLGIDFLWELRKTLKKSRNDFSFAELIDLAMFIKALDALDVKLENMSNIENFNLFLRDITLSGDVAQEALSLVVLNGTNRPNLAKKVSSVFENVGVRISFIGNAENVYQKSYLITNNPTQATIKYIRSYYPNINVISKEKALVLNEPLIDRGDAVLIVGFDILD